MMNRIITPLKTIPTRSSTIQPHTSRHRWRGGYIRQPRSHCHLIVMRTAASAYNPERNGKEPQPASASRLSAGFRDEGVTQIPCRGAGIAAGGCLDSAAIGAIFRPPGGRRRRSIGSATAALCPRHFDYLARNTTGRDPCPHRRSFSRPTLLASDAARSRRHSLLHRYAPIAVTRTRPCSSLPIWCWCRSGRVRRIYGLSLRPSRCSIRQGVLNQVTLNATPQRLPPPYLIMDESRRPSSPAVSAIPRL